MSQWLTFDNETFIFSHIGTITIILFVKHKKIYSDVYIIPTVNRQKKIYL